MREASALTSAEAGFAYALSRCGGDGRESVEVDPISSPVLLSFLASSGGGEERWDREALRSASVFGWWKRGAPGAQRDQKQVLTDIFRKGARLSPLQEYWRNQRLRMVLADMDEDLSALESGDFDLRGWLDGSEELPLAARLVILGGVLVGALESVAMRRKLAATVGKLPPVVQQRIHRGMVGYRMWDEGVVRRIYEVYCRIARQRKTADEELARLGLFFLISASVFRQSNVLRRLKQGLPAPLARRVDPYFRACISSGKPELSPVIGEVVQGIAEKLEGADG